MTDKISVFIVDDSAIVRTIITNLLQNETEIEVLGSAADPVLAEAKFDKLGWPDVIILDIEMPKMDGITFLRKIMKEHPTPVIICSAVAQNGSRNAIEALSIGAVEVISKPEVGVKSFLEELQYHIVHSIKAAFESKKFIRQKVGPKKIEPSATQKNDADAVLALKSISKHIATHMIVAIGSSTGGVQTLEKILPQLPQKTPPILITQHMPAGFTRSLADRLNRLCELTVKEAEDGDRLLHGRVLIAQGDKHMTLKRNGNSYVVEVKDGPKVSRHKPSVDVLFRSCANEAGKNALGIILTGMGDDGARGLKEMKDKGAMTVAQDKESCVVYGMPKEAVAMDAVVQILTLPEIVELIKKA